MIVDLLNANEELKLQHSETRMRREILEDKAAIATLEGDASATLEVLSQIASESGSAYYDQYRNPNNWASGPQSNGYNTPVIWGDRTEGQARPFLVTETDLGVMRTMARVLCDSNVFAKGVMANLENYVIGEGFTHKFVRKSNGNVDDSVLRELQYVLDEFLDENDWVANKERESFRRLHRDGESFGRLHYSRGKIKHRFIDPYYVTEPAGAENALEEHLSAQYSFLTDWSQPMSWKWGLLTPESDVEDTLGYFVNWGRERQSADYEFVPHWEVVHTKVNVDSDTKRGISDFFPGSELCRKTSALLDSTITGATIQASIAYIRRHAAGVSKLGASNHVGTIANALKTVRDSGGGTKQVNTQNFDAGTVLDVPNGQEHLPGPMGAPNGPVYLDVEQGGLRAFGVRWQMPEYMVSGDASNANFASTVEAGTPFVKSMKAAQGVHKRETKELVWKVIQVAYDAGMLDHFGMTFRDIKASVELQVTGPDVERNGKDETDRRKVLHDDGIISKSQWAAEEGHNHEEEIKKGAKPVEQSAPVHESAAPFAHNFWGDYP